MDHMKIQLQSMNWTRHRWTVVKENNSLPEKWQLRYTEVSHVHADYLFVAYCSKTTGKIWDIDVDKIT